MLGAAGLPDLSDTRLTESYNTRPDPDPRTEPRAGAYEWRRAPRRTSRAVRT